MVRQPVLLLAHGDAGRRALDLAVTVALRHRACLTLLLAIDSSPPWWAGTGGGVDHARAQRETEAAGERMLAQVRDGLPDAISVRTRVLRAQERAAVQVIRVLREGDHDLLVMEAPGRRPSPSGHGSAWLLRHSPIPVVTVHGRPDRTAREPLRADLAAP